MPEHGTPEQDHFSQVYHLIMAAWGSQAVRAIASLSVAEHLDRGPLSAHDIALRESSDPDMTYRVLRTGAALGLLSYDAGQGTFTSTSMLAVLHADSPTSLKHYAQAAIGPAFWLPAVLLPEAVAAGSHQAAQALGSNVFEYLGKNPEEARKFSAAMTDLSAPVIREAAAVIDVGTAQTVIDVGGAHGAFVSELVQRNPQLTGSVLELAHVAATVEDEARKRGLGGRITGVAGDFFEAVPASDIYLLKHVLHDWDDTSCRSILSNIRSAMRPGARLFIIEMLVSDSGASSAAALMDMAMLFATTGQERDLPQFDTLLTAAGLRRTQAVPLRSPYYLIEADAL
ncbi:methyltransferase [Streptomyces sp. NBC_01483]|uniref:methyltransferase n=1 Tax=Streptomyces sp. NBC_01483 TaxID=2903883 RepID=UPI002E31877E|nr:methyltransferase [Streptomyces sp. NBC_01483]